jgi:hypothetical protein
MKLERMFKNILHYSHNELVYCVEIIREKRASALQASANFDVAPNKRSRSTAPALNAAEKAILKSLGLSLKDLKSLSA